MTSFRIQRKPDSWNALARKSYWAYKPIFDAWHALTWHALARLDPKRAEGAVRIIATARWKDGRRRDLDNILLKPVLDTMVRYGLLQDDQVRNVAEIVVRGFLNQDEDSLEIEVHPFLQEATDRPKEA